MDDPKGNRSRWNSRLNAVAINVAGGLVLYGLSCGPVLGAAFWLREATHNDMFYAVMWLYYPLLVTLGRFPLVHWYIEWWVADVFGTVGPG